jgi:hypothetical protein
MNSWNDSTAWTCDTLTLGINSYFLYNCYAFAGLRPRPRVIENSPISIIMEAAHA